VDLHWWQGGRSEVRSRFTKAIAGKKYQDAQDFHSSSRSDNRRIAGLCNCCRNAEDGRKDKQAGIFLTEIT
jgi:hypothetical protein